VASVPRSSLRAEISVDEHSAQKGFAYTHAGSRLGQLLSIVAASAAFVSADSLVALRHNTLGLLGVGLAASILFSFLGTSAEHRVRHVQTQPGNR
jgi:hypothetical protein